MALKGGNPDAYDVVVIGSGSGGLAAARGAAGRGLTVALVERDAYLGGECPNYACVPTKTLLRAADTYLRAEHADEFGLHLGEFKLSYAELKRHKDHIVAQTGARHLTTAALKADGIDLVRGSATFLDQHTIGVGPSRLGGRSETSPHRLSARQVVLACGSSTRLPSIEGLKDVSYLTSKSALELTRQPQSIIILGAGPVGIEFAQIFASFGSDVTLLVRESRILLREEPETAAAVARSLIGYGVDIRTNFIAERVARSEEGVLLEGKNASQTASLAAEHLLLATGQQPTIDGLQLERVGVKATERGIVVDDYLQTTVPHIWAVGDVVGGLQFTHTAHAMGVLVGYNLTNVHKQKLDFRVVPRVVFSHVELASVGQVEAELHQSDRDVVTGFSPIGGLSRALTDSEPEGLVKIVADATSGEVLGASIACVRAGEMIHELALAMQLQASVRDLVTMIHAFPTYSEAIRIAAADAAKKLG